MVGRVPHLASTLQRLHAPRQNTSFVFKEACLSGVNCRCFGFTNHHIKLQWSAVKVVTHRTCLPSPKGVLSPSCSLIRTAHSLRLFLILLEDFGINSRGALQHISVSCSRAEALQKATKHLPDRPWLTLQTGHNTGRPCTAECSSCQGCK